MTGTFGCLGGAFNDRWEYCNSVSADVSGCAAGWCVGLYDIELLHYVGTSANEDERLASLSSVC